MLKIHFINWQLEKGSDKKKPQGVAFYQILWNLVGNKIIFKLINEGTECIVQKRRNRLI